MTDSDGEIDFNCEENDCESSHMLFSEANNFEPQETQFSYINSDFQRDVLLMSEEFENACLEPFDVNVDYEDDFQNHCEDVNTTKYFNTEKVFHDRNELINWAKDVGKEHGVVIVIGKSQNAQGGKAARLWLTCERSGKHRVHKKNIEKNKPKKNTGTKKTNCPFKLRGRSIPNSTNWTVSVENGCHNHPLAKALEGHSYAGRLTQEELDLVKMMTKSGAKPKQCMIMLKQRDPSNLSVTRHVYNAKQKFRMTDMEGRTQMQEILGSLRQKGYLESNRRSENGDVLSQLFWAHPESVQLAKSFPYVFIMDATYKTNKLHWPFLQIVGVTSTGKTFTACQVLMEKEKVLDFTWALERFRDLLGELPSVIVTDRDFALMNAADKIFPDSSKQLCRWHISMAVLRKGKKIFKKDDDKVDKLTNMWGDVVNSDTENDFALNFSYIERDFIEYPKLIKYLRSTWLPHKERFIAAWTDRYLHFGNMTTNRAEGSHASLKRDLGFTCKHDFLGMWSLVHPALTVQMTEIRASFEQSLGRTQHQHTIPLFNDIRGFISRAALDELLVEIKQIGDMGIDQEICGHYLRRTHGLPCAHELAVLQQGNRSIPLSYIHDFWKVLSINPIEDVSEIDYRPAVEFFIKGLSSSTEDQKRYLLKRVVELVDPYTTCLKPPVKEVKARGRPKGSTNKNNPKESNEDWSTTRLPSGFEYVTTPRDLMSQKSFKRSKQTPYKSSKKGNTTVFFESIYDYKEWIPSALFSYIVGFENPISDGNCGFRALCMALGINENSWVWMRQQLLEELCDNQEEYISFFGVEGVRDLKERLKHFEGNAPPKKWMDMPSTGYLFASKFNVVLVQFSIPNCFTFLPLRSSAYSHTVKVLGCALVGNHYLKLDLKNDCPIPEPVLFWKRFHYEPATSWNVILMERMAAFKLLNISGVAVSEAFEEDHIMVED